MNRKRIIGVLAVVLTGALPMAAQARNCHMEGDVLKCGDGVSYRQTGVATVTTTSPDGRTAKKLVVLPSPDDGTAPQQAGNGKSAGEAKPVERKPDAMPAGN